MEILPPVKLQPPRLAVLTAEVVPDPKLPAATHQQLKQHVSNLSTWVKSLSPGGALTHSKSGDVLLVQLPQAHQALRVALLLRLNLFTTFDRQADLRVAIGLGDDKPSGSKPAGANPQDSSGSAHARSNRTLEFIKTQKQALLGLSCGSILLDQHWRMLLRYLDHNLRANTRGQAEAVLGLLQHREMRDIGQLYNVSKQAIQQRATGAKWPLVEAHVEFFESLFGPRPATSPEEDTPAHSA